MKKIISLITFSLFLGTSLSAQEIKHDVSVTLKLIQVYVTDSRDKPVTDLNLDEFVITDNKEPYRITEFERYVLDPGQKEKKSFLSEKERAALSKFDSRTMNRKFFLFFDLVNNSTQGFRKAQEAAFHFIDTQLQPSDEVGVLSFSMIKGLTLHEYLSSNHEAIHSAVQDLGREGLVGRVENFEAELYRQLTGESPLDASQSSKSLKTWVPEHAMLDSNKNDRSKQYELFIRREEHKKVTNNLISKLSDLSKAMRYIPGNKHMLFFSSGIPYSLIFGDPRQIFPMDTLLRNQYEDMLQEMSNANTSVFCLNTEPLISDVNVPLNYKGGKTLRKMAQYTGGKFLGNVQNYAETLETVQAFTGSYYVLGYYVDESWDGRYHRIKVEVTRPGCRVFSQKGYFNPQPFSKYSNLEKKLHLIDLALSETSVMQSPVSLHMTAVPCPIAGGSGVLLMAEIPGEIIQERLKGKVEILFLVFDDRGNILDVRRQEMDISGLKGREGLDYSLLSLSPGRYRFRAVMRDLESGSCAVGQVVTEIPESGRAAIELLPPLLLKAGRSPLFIRGYIPETETGKFPLLDHFPFDPKLYSPVLDIIPQGTGELTACLHVFLRNPAGTALQLTADLIMPETGQRFSLPLNLISITNEGNLVTLLANIQLPQLPSGDYILTLEAHDKMSGGRSQTSVSCKIDSIHP
jgi:VWFA-related protein